MRAAEWRLPQAGLGIIPAQGGTIRLARWVGKGLAMRAALGFPMTADEAFRIGLAQWLVKPDALLDKAMEVAEHIAALPPLAARLTKESLRSGLESPLPEAVASPTNSCRLDRSGATDRPLISSSSMLISDGPAVKNSIRSRSMRPASRRSSRS